MRQHVRWIVIVGLVVFLNTNVYATIIQRVTVDELLRSSELIIEGRVLSKYSRPTADGQIHTYIIFEILDVIKGEYGNATIELRFLGGTFGDIAFEVSEMIIPEIGEHGVYFIESTKRFQVNPLFGWDQGHFTVKRGPTGSALVFTARGFGVSKLIRVGTKASGVSSGIAMGIQIADGGSPAAMTLDTFKNEVRALLKNVK